MTREEAKKIMENEVRCVRNPNCERFECRNCYLVMPEHTVLKAYEVAIKALEQTRWIPVSEGLPEVGSEVLVCFDFKGKRGVYISNFYGDGEFHGLDDEYLTSEGRKYRKAVAWMPLPEPYRAESEDKLDGNPVDIGKAVEHYEGTLEALKGIDLEVDG